MFVWIALPVLAVSALVAPSRCPTPEPHVEWARPGGVVERGAVAPQASYGYRDSATGRVRPPRDRDERRRAEKRLAAARERAAAKREPAAERLVQAPVRGPAGGVRLRLPARYRSGMAAVRKGDEANVSCGRLEVAEPAAEGATDRAERE